MLESLNAHARRVIKGADAQARQLDHPYTGTEHLLLALLSPEVGIAYEALQDQQVNYDSALSYVEEMTGHSSHSVLHSNTRSFTPDLCRVLEQAKGASDKLGHSFVGPEHLLLGLIAWSRSVAGMALDAIGCDFEALKASVIRLLSSENGIFDTHPSTLSLELSPDEMIKLYSAEDSAMLNLEKARILERRARLCRKRARSQLALG